jgi:hypothetical protein
MLMPSLETILQHPDLGKSVVGRETMLALRACCRAGRAVVDKFAEEVWYPSLFQEIFRSAVIDNFLNLWGSRGVSRGEKTGDDALELVKSGGVRNELGLFFELRS